MIQAFRPYGNIRIEWPGKDSSSIPKGYLYIIFEHEKQVRSLLSACTQDFGNGGGSWYFKVISLKVLEFLHFFKNVTIFQVSSKRMRNKEVQVIPWVIGDSTYVRCPTSRMDANKTVFVGALHGMLSAECLANIFQDLFKGVVYAGIDTDKYKYPIGSGRVVFNNNHSYMKAVSAAFIEIKTTKFTKKVSIFGVLTYYFRTLKMTYFPRFRFKLILTWRTRCALIVTFVKDHTFVVISFASSIIAVPVGTRNMLLKL